MISSPRRRAASGSWAAFGRSPSAASGTTSTLALTLGCALLIAFTVVQANRIAVVAIGVAGLLLLVVVLASLGDKALAVWLAVSGIVAAFAHVPAHHSVLTFDRAWLGAMALVVLARRSLWRMTAPNRRLLLALGALSLSYLLRSLLNPAHKGSGLATALDAVILPTVLFIWCAHVARADRWTRVSLPALAFGGVLLAVLGIVEATSGLELASIAGGAPRFDTSLGLVRVSGPYQVPEVYALVLLMCLAGTILWIQLRPRRINLVGAGLVGLELVALYLTYFRAAWIAGLVVVVSSVAIRPRQWLRSAVALLLAASIVGATFVELHKSSTGFTSRVGDTSNISGRLAGYKQGVELWKVYPIFGVGVNQYASKIGNVPVIAVAGVRGVKDPHSSFVQILVEQGVVGLATFLLVIAGAISLIRNLARRARSREDLLLLSALRGAGIAYLVMSVGLAMLPYGDSNAFFLALLGLGAGRLDRLMESDGDAAAQPEVADLPLDPAAAPERAVPEAPAPGLQLA